MKLLITGFDPFGGEKINPSFEAVKRLPDEISGYKIIKKVIPTVFYKSAEVLEAVMEDQKPNIVICVGQSGGGFTMAMERVAINLMEARIPDNEGQQPLDGIISKEGENAYFSTLPCKGIVNDLIKNNIPAGLSYTAGTFVCNYLFYCLMHMMKRKYTDAIGGFIHVPNIPEQVLRQRNTPFMSLDMITRGLEIAIETCIQGPGTINIDHEIPAE